MGDLIRYGIISTGMMGAEHIRNILLQPNAKITAIADPVETSLRWAREALGDAAKDVVAFDSSAALARGAKVDAVVMGLGSGSHKFRCPRVPFAYATEDRKICK